MRSARRSKVKGQSGLALLALAALAACAEHSRPSQVEPPAVRPDGIVAYLVAAPAGAPNEYIVRAVTRHGIAVEGAASFVAAVRIPARTVAFISDASDAQVVRASSMSDETFRIAGAAPEGMSSGELFTLRLRAARAEDVNALRLELTEINDRSGASLKGGLVVLPYVTWGP
ncbi:MAG TPA: hypothetical protein VJ717_08310, partial [Gemmatimonadaceae bacterium]|nr:hypothetical protein [Gemmatimonadaceae bacterium]